MQVQCQNLSVRFICHGHWVKIKVTGAKKVLLHIAYQLVSGRVGSVLPPDSSRVVCLQLKVTLILLMSLNFNLFIDDIDQ